MAYSSQGSHTGQKTSATDRQIAARRDNVISITLHQVYLMSTFLIRFTASQSSSYPIVLTRLGGPLSRPNPHLKFVEVPGIEPTTPWTVVRHANHYTNEAVNKKGINLLMNSIEVFRKSTALVLSSQDIHIFSLLTDKYFC